MRREFLLLTLGLVMAAGCKGRPQADPRENEAVAAIEKLGARVARGETGSVVKVDFTGTEIDDSALEPVAKLSGVETLDLKGTQVSDKGLAHLKGLTSLRYLHVHRTRVTDKGVKELKSTLPELTVDR